MIDRLAWDFFAQMTVPLLISGPEVWSAIFDLSCREVDFDLKICLLGDWLWLRLPRSLLRSGIFYRVTDSDSGYQEVDFNLGFVYRVTDLDSGYQEVDFDLEFYRVTDLVAINRLR